jgi:predicted ATPase
MELGRHSEAVEGYERSLTLLGDAGARLVMPFFRAGMARALAACGRVGDALQVIDQAIGDLGSLRWCEAELWRVRGELCLAEPNQASHAEAWFERALVAARTQHSVAWELRAALSLVRLRVALGRDDDGRSVLGSLVNALEGRFDTADLRDAKRLLLSA